MVELYGIETCGTVKKARSWLEDRGVDHGFTDFRSTPVDADRIAGWVQALGSRALRNTSGKAYRALPPEKTDWSDEEWTTRFAADPMLIKRPVIEIDGAVLMAGFRDPDLLSDALDRQIEDAPTEIPDDRR